MRLTERVHIELEACLELGDMAIDATAGNGHDVLKLAQLVGPKGRVVVIDIQEAALTATRQRMKAANVGASCDYICGDHARELVALLSREAGNVAAITFNLGYFPGGDKAITTLAASTIPALNASKELLKPGGSLFVTAYRGHGGGMDEAMRVAEWMQLLPVDRWSIECHEPEVSSGRVPPILWIARQVRAG